MPVTLTESPQSPAAPNSKPLSIWITDYIPLFPPSRLFPLSPLYAFFNYFLHPSITFSPLPSSPALYSCPHSCVFQSFILVFRAPREYQHYASLRSTLLGGGGGGGQHIAVAVFPRQLKSIPAKSTRSWEVLPTRMVSHASNTPGRPLHQPMRVVMSELKMVSVSPST